MISWHPTYVTKSVYSEDGKRSALAGKRSEHVIIGKVGPQVEFVIVRWPDGIFTCHRGWNEQPFAEALTGEDAKGLCQDMHADSWVKRDADRDR